VGNKINGISHDKVVTELGMNSLISLNEPLDDTPKPSFVVIDARNL